MNRFKDFLWTTFIGGFLVVLPIAILIAVFRAIVKFLNRVIQPISGLFELREGLPWYIVDGIAVLIIILACFFIGLFVRTRSGKMIYRSLELNLLEKLPLYNIIKETVLQFTGMKDSLFSRVVLVQPFGTGAWMTGFVTDEHPDGLLTVFAPTGPNPTNGYILHVEKDQVQELEAPTEDAIRSIISVGVGSKELRFPKETESPK